MVPTVFCLVVPLILNICSVPIEFEPSLHIRHERSITLNTGNASGLTEGKIVNTAQTDKQLIINIETKVLPMFNIYLDSLQQSPRLQCTSSEDLSGESVKKRIFTCSALSNLCCPSTISCICTEQIQPTSVTTFPPIASTTATEDCRTLCAQCGPTVLPTAIIIPQTEKPLFPSNEECRKLCSQCIPTAPPTAMVITSIPTAIIPTKDECRRLCILCAPTVPPSTSIVIFTSSPIPFYEDCKALCIQCTPTVIPPTALTVSPLACTELCKDLCKRCGRQLLPGSKQCTELCSNCKTSQPEILEPNTKRCTELCNQCQIVPPKPTTVSNPNCISCNSLCRMCSRNSFQKWSRSSQRYRKKRQVRLGGDDDINNYIEKDNSVASEFEVNTNGCSKYGVKCKTMDNLSSKENHLTPGSQKCTTSCENPQNPPSTACPPAIPWPHYICKELCSKCKHWRPIPHPNYLIPDSSECQKYCQQCKQDPNPSQTLFPGSVECFKNCKKCIKNLQPGSLECNKLCKQCNKGNLKIRRTNCTHDFNSL